jgi:carboxybiotin decarboxylase
LLNGKDLKKMDKFLHFISQTGFANIELSSLVMMVIALFLMYLGIAKKYEPLLLVPISFGMLLVNFPLSPLMALPENGQPGGLLHYLYLGIELGIYPPLIFLGIGALTDFSPLISNPKTLLLGAAAQIGIFGTFLGALALGFTAMEAGSIGIIGGRTALLRSTFPHRWPRTCLAPSPWRPIPTWRSSRSFNHPLCAF